MADLKSRIRCCLLYDFKRRQEVISERQCRRWFHKFRSGNENHENDARSRPPSVVDMEQLKEAIEEDPNQTTSDLANRFGCSHPTIMRWLYAIGKSSRSSQWIPYKLIDISSVPT
ncbi:hypothetical protein Y032_0440g1504 [Ancylostoma ceylanicum]|uniref:Mos1 transposase HTH domain-containing protein n=1 Tax=Ancylostoma ceylanicum TaxID=53326 RepID=A0A016WZ34_9BILA|nr:hypothetical protein Y032_0440g1504 [Ancylostoma ceylanicum]